MSEVMAKRLEETYEQNEEKSESGFDKRRRRRKRTSMPRYPPDYYGQGDVRQTIRNVHIWTREGGLEGLTPLLSAALC